MMRDATESATTRWARGWVVAAVAVVVAGAAVRAAMIPQLDVLHGDVNLFAMSARSLAEHGRLAYPFKYVYLPEFEYRTLSQPAVQHTPLWPAAAGAVAWVLRTDATYPIMQWMSWVCGVATLAAVPLAMPRQRAWVVVLAMGMMAAQPFLADFSGTGSPYSLMVLITVLFVGVMARFELSSVRSYVLAGALVGLGFLTHNALVALALACFVFAVVHVRRLRWAGVAAGAGVMVLVASPYVAWNLIAFGKPLVSSVGPIAEWQVGIRAHFVDEHGRVVMGRTGGWDRPAVRRYLGYLYHDAFSKQGQFRDVAGPGLAVLAAVGAVRLWRRDRALLEAAGWFVLSNLFVLLVFPFSRTRFTLPIVAALCVLAAIGVAGLVGWRRRWGIVAAALLVAGVAAWWGVEWARHGVDRYAAGWNDAKDAEYAKSRRLAAVVARQPEGVVLSVAMRLDGGIESAYWHGRPMVAGKYPVIDDPSLAVKLADDFGARYLWSDDRTRDVVETYFPDAEPIASTGPFDLWRLPG